MCHNYLLFFFFQAEDGIRDVAVTGVQTCALPIWRAQSASLRARRETRPPESGRETAAAPPRLFSRQAGRPAPSKADRKSTRLNSSHGYISYAVFCLKKKRASSRRRRAPRHHHRRD